jgi:hypothetical protein
MTLRRVAEFAGAVPMLWSPDGRHVATSASERVEVWDFD